MKNKITDLDTVKVSGRKPNRNVIDVYFDCPGITGDIFKLVIPKIDKAIHKLQENIEKLNACRK